MATNVIPQIQGGAQVVFIWLIIMLGVAIIVLFLWLIWWVMSYKNRALVYNAEQGNRAKIVRFKVSQKKGIVKFFMRKPNKMIIPSADCFAPFGKKAMFFAVEKNGAFFMPLRKASNPGFLKEAGDFRAMGLWYANDLKETIETYTKKMGLLWQFLPWIAFVFLLVVHLILFMMLIKKGDVSTSTGVGATVAQYIPGT